MRLICTLLGALFGTVLGAVTGIATLWLLDNGMGFLAGNFLGLSLGLGIVLGLLLGGLVGWHLARFWQSGSTPRKRYLVTGAIVLVPLLLTGGMVAAVVQQDTPPTDRFLIAHFKQHQAPLEQVIALLRENPELSRVDQTWTNPNDPASIHVSAERIALYRKLLEQAGVPRGFSTMTPNKSVEFYYWLRGSVVTDGISKGFAYCTTPPQPLATSLDKEELPRAYRHILGDWYLFYEYTPG